MPIDPAMPVHIATMFPMFGHFLLGHLHPGHPQEGRDSHQLWVRLWGERLLPGKT